MGHGGSQTYNILQLFVCSFAINSFLLRENDILRDLEVPLLRLLITELLVAPCLLSLSLDVRRSSKKRQCSVMII
jgi:hypothetical protein